MQAVWSSTWGIPAFISFRNSSENAAIASSDTPGAVFFTMSIIDGTSASMIWDIRSAELPAICRSIAALSKSGSAGFPSITQGDFCAAGGGWSPARAIAQGRAARTATTRVRARFIISFVRLRRRFGGRIDSLLFGFHALEPVYPIHHQH